MAGRINDEDIQVLRERAQLATLVADYTALRQAGTRLTGLCPFHEEKTPSFTVDPARGLFHCFGCGEGGDVYAFLQRIEALSFPEAVERLARIVGYELRYSQLSPGQRRALGRRTRLAQALSEAARFFQGALTAPGGAPARDYLAGRGVDGDAVEHFRLGWAPDAWDALVRHLQGEGFEPQEVADAGLAARGRDGPIDFFRGRVVFPILDKTGRDVVAFGGRVVPGLALRTGPRDGDPPKYKNSPETAVYRKAETLYGLNWARAEIQRRDTALVVEGYMDVIGLYTAGVRHAVATCGTAPTAEHFRQLEQFCRRVVLALDADDAGYAAAERARGLATEAGIREVGVLPLAQGQDPADLAAEGAERVEAALARPKTAVEFQIEHLLRNADTTTPEGQVDAYRRTFPLLARLDDRFLRYGYIRDVVAPAVRLSADLIERELDGALASAAVPDQRERPSRQDAAGPARPTPIGDLAGEVPRDPQMRLEREVLQAALQLPHLLPPEWKHVTVDDFRAPMSQTLFAVLSDVSSNPADGSDQRDDLDAVLAALPDEATRARVRALTLAEPTVEADAGHVAELVARLLAASLQREIDDVRQRMARVGEQLDPDDRRRLTARHAELIQRRAELLEGRDA
ncbi:MAG: DNA primase [Actinomycetota bacterium]|nr:DNA primase [Actinomycetota bacterium]